MLYALPVLSLSMDAPCFFPPTPCARQIQPYIQNIIRARYLRKGASLMEEICRCMVVTEDDRMLCVKDEKCCEEARKNLEPHEC
jgi:hypothetical protein